MGAHSIGVLSVPGKACCKCGEHKDLIGFYKNKSTKDGLTPDCKECVKARVKKYRDDNPDTVKKQKKEYYENNKEKVAASSLEYKRKNGRYRKDYLRYRERIGLDQYREDCRERSARYRERNRERVRERAREYRNQNLERCRQRVREYRKGEEYKERRRKIYQENPWIERLRTAMYRATKLQATPSWSDEIEVQRVYRRAAEMSKEGGARYHVDHIVPLQSDLVCGMHCPHNLQILTESENCRKSNLWWPDMPEEVAQ